MPKEHDYRHVLAEQFDGLIHAGAHAPDEGIVCALELVSYMRGLPLTDAPELLGVPDLRPINDAAWSGDGVRTACLLPLLVAYDDWVYWPESRRRAVADLIERGLITDVLPMLLRVCGLHPAADRCASARSLDEATQAAHAASKDCADELSKLFRSARRRNVKHTTGIATLASALAVVRTISLILNNTTLRSAICDERMRAAATVACIAAGVRVHALHSDGILGQVCRVWLDAANETRRCSPPFPC